jgi:hypothetical protein
MKIHLGVHEVNKLRHNHSAAYIPSTLHSAFTAKLSN